MKKMKRLAGFLAVLVMMVLLCGCEFSNNVEDLFALPEMPEEFTGLNQLLGELEREIRPDSIQVVEHLAVLAAVGRRMAFTPGISGKIFGALGAAGINVRMIMQGLAELNMLIGVENKDFDNAVRVLYDTFMK